MANGLTANPGLSIPTGLSVSAGESVGNGLSFPGFGGATPPGPPGNNGILLEGSVTDFLMLENGTEYLLQE